MAYVRYYMPFDLSGTPSGVFTAYGSQWDTTDAAQRTTLVNSKPGVDNSVPHSVSSMGAGQRGLIAQGVSGPLAAGILTGRLRAAYRGYQDDINGDCHLTLTARVVSSDGTVERGVLVSAVDAVSEYDSTFTIRTIPVTELSTVVASSNDIFVFEIGIARMPGASSTTSAATLELSSKNLNTDVPYSDSVPAGEKVGWIEIEIDTPPILASAALTGTGTFSAYVFGPRTAALTGSGVFTATRKLAAPPLFATLESSTITRAPATLNVFVSSANPGSYISAEIDGTVVATGRATSDGIAQVVVPITATLGGSAGSHDILLRQTYGSDSSETDVLSYTVEEAPAALPVAPAPDPDPVVVPGSTTPSGRKWVFQDPAVDGLGSYVLPVNPREMSSPHHEHAFSSRHSTALTGRYHVFQAAMMPKEWTFTGYCPTEEMAETLGQYRQLNRRIYIIDHHGRAWKVAITHLDITPRLRHLYNGEVSDWGSDWTMTVTVLDQEPTIVP